MEASETNFHGHTLQVERVVNCNCKLGEGPVWHPIENCLYWVDIHDTCFYRWCSGTNKYKKIQLSNSVSTLGVLQQGGLVLALENTIVTWKPEEGIAPFVEKIDAFPSGSLFNDGAVDRMGRFWVGTKSKGSDNALYCVSQNGSVRLADKGFTVSNGIGWSPDDRTMYFTDSRRKTILAYDYAATTGNISNRRIFCHTPDEPGVPDGLAVDKDGFLWSVRWGGWRINRYAPNGQLDVIIDLPVEYPTSCTFGGANLDELFITTADFMLNPSQRDDQPWAGGILKIDTPVYGLKEPFFNFQGDSKNGTF